MKAWRQFTRYSRNLKFSPKIFWVCHVKKYFQNAMNMILDFNLDLIFRVSNRIHEILLIFKKYVV